MALTASGATPSHKKILDCAPEVRAYKSERPKAKFKNSLKIRLIPVRLDETKIGNIFLTQTWLNSLLVEWLTR
jgi:hypothetical protein